MKEVPRVKSIEEWKSSLAAVSIAEPVVGLSARPAEAVLKREVGRPSKEKREEVEPPKLPLNLECFLGNLATLKKQLDEMDRILDRPEQAQPNKGKR
jgi:hypothetical protein